MNPLRRASLRIQSARLNEGGSQSGAAMIDEAKSDQPLIRSLHGSRLQRALSAWSWFLSLPRGNLQGDESPILRRSSMNRRASFTKPLPAQPHRASNRLVRGLGAPLEVQRY